MGGAKRAGSGGGGGVGGSTESATLQRVALATSPLFTGAGAALMKARRTGPAVPASAGACKRPGELLRPCVRSPARTPPPPPPQQQPPPVQQQQPTPELDATWSPPMMMASQQQQQQVPPPPIPQQQQQQQPRKSVRFAPGPLATAPDGHPAGEGRVAAPARRPSWAPPPPELTRAHLAALEELLGPECAPSMQRLRRRAGLASSAPARPPRVVLTVAGGGARRGAGGSGGGRA